MKQHNIIVSSRFPATHSRKGEPTDFGQSIIEGTKIYTVRENYPFWKKKIDEVNNREAVLWPKYWSRKPYCSPQKEYPFKFDDKSGLCVGQLVKKEGFLNGSLFYIRYNDKDSHDWRKIKLTDLAKNDGLSEKDFMEWFKNAPSYKPMALIHFTKFRYK